MWDKFTPRTCETVLWLPLLLDGRRPTELKVPPKTSEQDMESSHSCAVGITHTRVNSQQSTPTVRLVCQYAQS